MLNNHKYTAIMGGVVLLLFIHAGLLFNQQLGKYQNKRELLTDVIPQFIMNAEPVSVDNLTSLSISFGIEPTNPSSAEKSAGKPDDLNQAKAALLAVTEQGLSFAAKVLVHEQGKPRLVTLRVGDSLLEYQLTELSLTAAVFAKGDSQIILHMFKRDNSNVAANK